MRRTNSFHNSFLLSSYQLGGNSPWGALISFPYSYLEGLYIGVQHRTYTQRTWTKIPFPLSCRDSSNHSVSEDHLLFPSTLCEMWIIKAWIYRTRRETQRERGGLQRFSEGRFNRIRSYLNKRQPFRKWAEFRPGLPWSRLKFHRSCLISFSHVSTICPKGHGGSLTESLPETISNGKESSYQKKRKGYQTEKNIPVCI